MAFKKKGKVTKKKGKKSGGKRDEWSHEGGVVLDGKEAENAEEKGRTKRRLTQDREESIRRGKLKNNDRKKKQDFKKKMAKKVNFGDVVAKLQEEEASSNDGSDVEEQVAKKQRVVRANPLDVMDRLQLFVSKAKQQRVVSSDGEDGADSGEDSDADDDAGDESDEDEQYESDGSLGEDVDDQDDESAASGDEEDEQDKFVADQDVNDDAQSDAGDSDGEGEPRNGATSKSEYYYEYMFNQENATRSSEGGKMKHLDSVEDQDMEVYGALSFPDSDGALPVNPGPYRTIAQMPGLHKLFRGPAASARVDSETFPGVSAHTLPYLASYADTFVEGRDHANDPEVLQGMLVHAVTHTVKARAKVVRHNQKLKRKLQNTIIAAAVAKEAAKGSKKRSAAAISAAAITPAEASNTDDADVMRDQGFCRPRVLILCPFRSTALRIVQSMRAILGENTSVSGWDKLVDEFSAPEDEDAGVESRKPEDWKALFDKQNIDDDFKMGIQLNPGHGKGSGAEKGVYMRLFSDFFISDIILASPIGLRLAMGAPTKAAKPDKKSKDKKSSDLSPDFLSSVELVLLHQADVMYMQNWEHLDFVMKHANKLPTAAHDTDFSRVRQYFLEGSAAQHRQLIVSSHFNEPELQAFFREHAQSVAGSVRFKKNWGKGQLANVISGAKQVFQLVPGVRDFESQEDARFKYFKESVLAPVLRLGQKHTLIVTPSYLHYIRVRNELMSQEVNAAFVCEYSRDSEISRGRSRFFHGTKDVLLYSGRAHFFRRFLIRGARHVIFYSLPEYAIFYSELVNMLSAQTGESKGASEDGVAISCLVLYTAYERMALERIVGVKRCAQMISGAKATFMFC